MNPNVTLVQKPSIIQPLEVPTWNYEEIRSFMTSGIYSAEELEKLEDHMAFPLKRQALLESVVRRLADRPRTAESGNFQKLLDEDTFNKMSRSYFRSLYAGFIEFSAICAGIAGCVVVVQLIKLVIDTVVHGVTLYSIYGWSFRLLGAFFGSITTMLIHIGRPATNNNNDSNDNSNNNDVDNNPNSGNQSITPSAPIVPQRNLQNIQNANHTSLRSSLNSACNSAERIIDIESRVLNSFDANARTLNRAEIILQSIIS
ncbi:hypothetical protein TKK_0008013 [Trichogramma kaykai]